MVQESMIRKGPWTEQEDFKLGCFVGLFGDRRWDFIAKVSGLNRTGKSCRLRWVNYLHPGLKRGNLSPQEQRLVLELHSKLGNRWSKIARKLPGRTDNEIKNYWRTHMRKKAQEMKKKSSAAMSPSFSSSNSNCCSSASNNPRVDSLTLKETGEESFYDTGGLYHISKKKIELEDHDLEEGYSIDDIWKNIDMQADDQSFAKPHDHVVNYSPPLMAPSPSWDYYLEYSLWRMVDEEEEDQISKVFKFSQVSNIG